MTKSVSGIQRDIKVTGQKLGSVTSCKYLGLLVLDDCLKPEVLSRIARATAALTKQKPIWRDNNISLESKVKLMRFLAISVISFYRCISTLWKNVVITVAASAFIGSALFLQKTRTGIKFLSSSISG